MTWRSQKWDLLRLLRSHRAPLFRLQVLLRRARWCKTHPCIISDAAACRLDAHSNDWLTPAVVCLLSSPAAIYGVLWPQTLLLICVFPFVARIGHRSAINRPSLATFMLMPIFLFIHSFIHLFIQAARRKAFTFHCCAIIFVFNSFTFAICRRPSVRLSVCLPVCRSVCNVRAAYLGDWNFRQYFYAIDTLTIYWHQGKILRRSSQGNPSVRGVKHKRDSRI